MYAEKVHFDRDEKVLRKANASLHYTKAVFKAPKISEGKLVLTNKRLIL